MRNGGRLQRMDRSPEIFKNLQDLIRYTVEFFK